MIVYNGLESLRIFFTLVIVYFHMVRVYTAPLFPDLFTAAAQQIERAYLCVEFFFLMSGFLLFFSLQKGDSFFNFIKKKVIRLWPVFAFSIGTSILCFHSYDKYEVHICDLLFFQGSGLLLEQGANFNAWYVSSLFFAMVAYSYFLKNYVGKNAKSYITLAIYLSGYCIVHGIFDTYTRCLLRAFLGIGIGYMLGAVFSSLFTENLSKPIKKITLIVCYSLIELALLASVICILIFHKFDCNYIAIVVQFSGLLWCFIVKKGVVSSCLSKINFRIVGKYCYSIYVMQNLSFYISTRLIWKHVNFCSTHYIMAILLGFVVSIALGIITYHAIEVPTSKFLTLRFIKKG